MKETSQQLQHLNSHQLHGYGKTFKANRYYILDGCVSRQEAIHPTKLKKKLDGFEQRNNSSGAMYVCWAFMFVVLALRRVKYVQCALANNIQLNMIVQRLFVLPANIIKLALFTLFLPFCSVVAVGWGVLLCLLYTIQYYNTHGGKIIKCHANTNRNFRIIIVHRNRASCNV